MAAGLGGACATLAVALAATVGPAPTLGLELPQLGSEAAATRVSLAAALGDVGHPFGVAALWVLSRDADPVVRRAALAAAQARCAAEPPQLCARLLGLFVGDTDDEVAFTSRDALLDIDVGAALASAPRAYKFDLLQRMSGVGVQPAASSLAILRHLSGDDDPDLQDFAAWLLEH